MRPVYHAGEQGDQTAGETGKDERKDPGVEDQRKERDAYARDGADGKSGVVEHRLPLLFLKLGLEAFDLLLQAFDATDQRGTISARSK